MVHGVPILCCALCRIAIGTGVWKGIGASTVAFSHGDRFIMILAGTPDRIRTQWTARDHLVYIRNGLGLLKHPICVAQNSSASSRNFTLSAQLAFADELKVLQS